MRALQIRSKSDHESCIFELSGRSSRFDRYLRIPVITFLLFAAGSLALGSTFANAAIPQKKKLNLLQQGQAFYRGKTITFIAPTTAGAGNDINSRAVAQELGVELGATVNVVDEGSGNGIAGGDAIAHSIPNGLTIGYMTPLNELYDTIENVPGYNFNPERLAYLGGIPDGHLLLVTQSNSSYPNFASLLSSTPSHPVTFLGQNNNSILQAKVFMRAFGISVNWILSYGSSGALLQGFLRGDGPLALLNYSAIGPSITAGTARGLAIQAVSKSIGAGYPGYSALSAYPTVGTLEAKYPAKTAAERKARTYFSLTPTFDSFTAVAPSKTAPAEVRALQWAMKLAIRSNYMKATLAAHGLPAGYSAPATMKANYVAALTDIPGLTAVLNG